MLQQNCNIIIAYINSLFEDLTEKKYLNIPDFFYTLFNDNITLFRWHSIGFFCIFIIIIISACFIKLKSKYWSILNIFALICYSSMSILTLFKILYYTQMSKFITSQKLEDLFLKQFPISKLVTEENFYIKESFLQIGYYWIGGLTLFFLCLIISIISILLLGEQQLISNIHNVGCFSFFLICVLFMTTSQNIFIIYLSFEGIFLPTLYFVFKFGYAKNTDKAMFFTTIITLLGSFAILIMLIYIYYTQQTLTIYFLKTKTFSSYESFIFFFIIFFGFGVKIPLYPFHFWLTKIHVEAPAGFSIFLSGFLVKTAFFCFTLFTDLLLNSFGKFIFIFFILFSIIDITIKFFIQLDLKKFIALGTIQEMNLLLFTWFLKFSSYSRFINLFLLMHGILSSLLFYYADLIQRNTQTRNLKNLYGFANKSKFLKFFTWLLILFFTGFPLTIKFIIEYIIFINIFITLGFWGLFFLFSFFLISNIGFSLILLKFLYGTPEETVIQPATIHFSNFDLWICFFLMFIYIGLFFLM